ncbi:MAG TPA: hypothetical protein VHC86_05830 [Opitutaceae bacterium]|nr:hypothetical protein [Opitutaceae bacterium]
MTDLTIQNLQQAALGIEGGDLSALGTLQAAAEQAEWVIRDAKVSAEANPRALSSQASGVLRYKVTLTPEILKALARQARELANTLETAKAGARRDELMRQYRPDDIDPEFRQAVEDYFEQLSREGTGR